MTRKAALKPLFAPGEYLVTWDLPSAKGGTFEAHGALTVEGGRPPKGTAHGSFDDALEHYSPGLTGFPQRIERPALQGSLANGANVVLINAQVTYWVPSQAVIDADAAIITLGGINGLDAIIVSAFDIQIGGLDAIAGVAPIKSTRFPKGGTVGGTWGAELDPKDFRQEWNDPSAKAGLTYYGSFWSFDPYNFSINFSPVAWCRLDQPVELRTLLDDWIEPLRRVVSIATGRAEEITYLVVNTIDSGQSEPRSQVFGSGITQVPYESTRDEIDKVRAPLRLKADKVSLLDLVRNWQKLASDHHPLVETYGAMLHARDQHPRSRLLLLLQAIEGAHGFETKASFAQRLKKHSAKRDEIIGLVKESLAPSQRKFLERNLSKRPPGGLEPAINWLAGLLPGDVKARLEATPLVTAMKASSVGARNAPDALRIIRNDLAHGTRGYDAHELQQVVVILELVVRAYALRLLGCPAHVLERLLAD